jgi:hypothetical protein
MGLRNGYLRLDRRLRAWGEREVQMERYRKRERAMETAARMLGRASGGWDTRRRSRHQDDEGKD